MIKRMLVAALAIAMLTVSSPAHAQTTKPPGSKFGPVVILVDVKNNSNTCVWVSTAWGMVLTPWAWMDEGARFIRPGDSHLFRQNIASPVPGDHPWEVKVEGTFMEHANCTGKHARSAITRYNKGINVSDMGRLAKAQSTLTGTSVANYDVSTPHNY